MNIGDWVRRLGRGATPYHHVDSTVAGDVVTRCGRRMTTEQMAFWIADTPGRRIPERACKQCRHGVERDRA